MLAAVAYAAAGTALFALVAGPLCSPADWPAEGSSRQSHRVPADQPAAPSHA